VELCHYARSSAAPDVAQPSPTPQHLTARTLLRLAAVRPWLAGSRGVWAVVAGLLLVRLGLSVHMLDRPGLHYDELLFVNAADERIGKTFISSSFHGIPTMNMPYIGALKSWFYTPLFALVDPGPTSVRLPMILLTCAGLALLFVAVRRLVSTPVALLALVLMCFENSLLWLTRSDMGPAAPEFFLKCLGLLLIARVVERRSAASVAWLVLVLALGVFAKLNFIWQVNVVVVVSAAAALMKRDRLRAHASPIGVWVGGILLLYAVCGWWYVTKDFDAMRKGALFGTISTAWNTLRTGIDSILSGTWYHEYALGPLGARTWMTLMVLAAFALGVVLAGRRDPETGSRQLPVLALAAAVPLLVTQMLATREATAGWHFIAIYPFVFVVAAYGIVTAAERALRRPRHLTIAITAAAAAFLAYDGLLVRDYYRAVGAEPRLVAWSPAIYKLNRYLEARPGKVYSADWGLQVPLLALDPSPRYQELAFALQNPTPEQLDQLKQLLITEPRGVRIVRHAGSEVFAGVNGRLAAAMDGRYALEATIRSDAGAPVYAIYRRR
jgi:hypothetical protein